MGEVIDLDGVVQEIYTPGLYALADLPQRGSVAKQAFGAGWWELDEIVKFYLGQFVVVTGIAGHGKSTFVLNVLLKMALEQGVKSFMYVPENEGHLLEKLKLLWPGDDRSFEHFAAQQCFVQSAVPHEIHEPAHTIEWVLGKARDTVEEHKVEIVLIDPWNELDRAKPNGMLMTDYIGECLRLVKQFCRTLNAVVIIVAHPTKAVNENGGRTAGLADIEGCYTDDTEVLTKRGWMHHGQITLSDEVACFDPETSQVLYAEPSNVLRKEHDGEIFHFEGYGYDLAVTPQHRMLVKPVWDEPKGEDNGRGRPIRFKKDQWSFCRAQELSASQFSIPLGGLPIAGADPGSVTIASRTYPADAFWRLVGWYVAEGHVGPTGLTWSQAEGELAEEFTAAFAEVGIPATVGWQEPHGKGKLRTARWYVGNRFCPELVAWFRKNCGEGAAEKRIPAAVFDLSPRLKNIFLMAYLEGDGSKSGAGFSAVTVSLGLRDDLQRLAVELGIATNAGERQPFGNSQKAYHVRFGGIHRREVTMRTNRNLTRENYNGVVWCLTVPTGAYFVRRNGRVSVCGNSMNWFNKCDNGLIVVRDAERSTSKVISAKVREIGAGKVGVCHFTVDPLTGIFKPQYGASY